MESRILDAQNRPASITFAKPDDSILTTCVQQFDRAGNVQQIAESWPGGTLPDRTVTSMYRSLNRSVGLDFSTGSPGANGAYAYQYDHRTRRVVRSENGVDQRVVYSGGVSVQEYRGTETAPEVEYLRTAGYSDGPVGSLLYSVRNGRPSYNVGNSRGDVTGKLDGEGYLTYEVTYGAFGNREEEAGSSADRQRANTKEEDPHGLINDGFRNRDAECGVFLTRDPAGFVDGPNLYTYVRQNPWSKFDPLGLSKINLVGGPTAKPEKNHDQANDNYLKAAVRNAKNQKEQLNRQGSNENVHLIIHEPSYKERAKNDKSENNLSSNVDAAKKVGIKVTLVQSAKQMRDEMKKIADQDSVSELTYQGHSNSQNLLLNYGQTTPGKSTENLNADDITSAIQVDKITKNFTCYLGGCNLGNDSNQNKVHDQASGPSMAETLSRYYTGSNVIGSGGQTSFLPLGEGYLSPSSADRYNYWNSGRIVDRDQPEDIPRFHVGRRSIDQIK